MWKTYATLLHPENRNKVISAVLGAIVLLANYSGTLPALVQPYRDWIELAAYVIVGLNLVHVDPKKEMPKANGNRTPDRTPDA